jgi:hypothetical protein
MTMKKTRKLAKRKRDKLGRFVASPKRKRDSKRKRKTTPKRKRKSESKRIQALKRENERLRKQLRAARKKRAPKKPREPKVKRKYTLKDFVDFGKESGMTINEIIDVIHSQRNLPVREREYVITDFDDSQGDHEIYEDYYGYGDEIS